MSECDEAPLALRDLLALGGRLEVAVDRTAERDAHGVLAWNVERGGGQQYLAFEELVHLQRGRLGESARGEEADPFGSQPAKDELERSCRGRVEPLDVVDGDENGSFRGELGEERPDGRGDRALVGYGVARVGF